MRRVTLKDLESIVNRINRITNSPEASWTKDKSGKLRSNIGNYHLDGAYGGWTLHRMSNESGGVEDVLRVGYVSKPELQRLLFAFESGLNSKESNQ
jgi:hypothetical protein